MTENVVDEAANVVEQPELVANFDTTRERVLQAVAIDEIFANADDRQHGKAKQDFELLSDFS
ncbi:MAG: hypothetical protein R3C28_25370 [Pirellulaceae bacterium]